MESFGWSETGKLREQNEDAIYCDDQTGVYIVADGMGGHQAGEVASREAIRTFLAAYEEGKKEEVTDRIISSMAKPSFKKACRKKPAKEWAPHLPVLWCKETGLCLAMWETAGPIFIGRAHCGRSPGIIPM